MTDITHNHPAVKELGLEGFDHVGGTMHSWRCENPGRYPNYCTCPEEAVAIVRDNLTVDDLRNTSVGRELLAKGWDEGARATNRAWEHAYDGHPVDPDLPYDECQTCNASNPYSEEI